MTISRSPSQLELDLGVPDRVKPRIGTREGSKLSRRRRTESPASIEHFMEAICDPDNIETALDAVVRNKERPALMDHRQAVAEHPQSALA